MQWCTLYIKHVIYIGKFLPNTVIHILSFVSGLGGKNAHKYIHIYSKLMK